MNFSLLLFPYWGKIDNNTRDGTHNTLITLSNYNIW